ncbi:hypothetical protein L6R49_09295 [Myxococcota bacterium]|nr:hypothetical protein [Myxococcota bacterium]
MTPLCALDLPTTAARLRAVAAAPERWWSPDASLRDGLLRAEGQLLHVDPDGDGLRVWGDGLDASLRCLDGRVEVWAEVDPADLHEHQLAWASLLDGLGFAARLDAPPVWARITAEAALSYSDAWTKLIGPRGLRGVRGRQPGQPLRLRLGRDDEGLNATMVRSAPPRAFTLDLDAFGGARLRVGLWPGATMTGLVLDLLSAEPADDALLVSWREALVSGFRPAWLDQVSPVEPG